jgi:hypothetical protein
MSQYHCTTCGKLKPADNSMLKIGDKLNFTKVSEGGRRLKSTRMTSVTGKIIQIFDDTFSVIYRGTLYAVNKADGRHADAPSHLTYVMLGECQCGVKEQPHD